MGTDMEIALHDIVKKEGGLNKDDAKAHVKQLKDDKRYLQNVY
jgi:sulfite reductase alpha subunit-like flavoprotein